eukprot:g2730.t1
MLFTLALLSVALGAPSSLRRNKLLLSKGREQIWPRKYGGGDKGGGDMGGGGEMNEGEMNDGDMAAMNEFWTDTTNFTQGNKYGQYLPAGSYEKIFMIWFENKQMNATLSNQYWGKLINESAFLLTNYYGISYPSQPNYVGFMAGSLEGCSDDSQQFINSTNLVDLLEKAGKSWKGYMESYEPAEGGDCNLTEKINNLYFRKHNPFFSFTSITSDINRCQKVSGLKQLFKDIVNDELPNFAFMTPNIKSDSHDEDLDYSGLFLYQLLEEWVRPYPEAWEDVLIFITFEADDRGDNDHVPAFFIADENNLYLKTPGSDIEYEPLPTNHYSMTKFVIENFCLGYFGKYEQSANPVKIPYQGKQRSESTCDMDYTFTTSYQGPNGGGYNGYNGGSSESESGSNGDSDNANSDSNSGQGGSSNNGNNANSNANNNANANNDNANANNANNANSNNNNANNNNANNNANNNNANNNANSNNNANNANSNNANNANSNNNANNANSNNANNANSNNANNNANSNNANSNNANNNANSNNANNNANSNNANNNANNANSNNNANNANSNNANNANSNNANNNANSNNANNNANSNNNANNNANSNNNANNANSNNNANNADSNNNANNANSNNGGSSSNSHNDKSSNSNSNNKNSGGSSSDYVRSGSNGEYYPKPAPYMYMSSANYVVKASNPTTGGVIWPARMPQQNFHIIQSDFDYRGVTQGCEKSCAIRGGGE